MEAASAVTDDVPETTKLAVERYVDALIEVAADVVATEQLLDDLVEAGWPTKARGDTGPQLEELRDRAAQARQGAEAIAPQEPELGEVHLNLVELTQVYTQLAADALAVDRDVAAATAAEGDRPSPLKTLLAAREAAATELAEWLQPLRLIAARTGADLTPLARATEAHDRPFGERLKRLAIRLVRPFLPIVPVSAERLFVAPFKPPYGPLSPPTVTRFAAAAARLVGRIPVLGLIVTVYVWMIGLCLSAIYYMALVSWWIVAGVWISLILTLLRRRA